jgi:phage terminase small subunit
VIDNLTVRQRRFVEEYLVDFNGALRWSSAGYGTKYPANDLPVKCFKHPGILAAIDQLQPKRSEVNTQA